MKTDASITDVVIIIFRKEFYSILTSFFTKQTYLITRHGHTLYHIQKIDLEILSAYLFQLLSLKISLFCLSSQQCRRLSNFFIIVIIFIFADYKSFKCMFAFP